MAADSVSSRSPWHLVIIIDDSGSMSGPIADCVNQAFERMLDEMKILLGNRNPRFRLSLVAFGSRPYLLAEYASEKDIATDQVTNFSGGRGGTAVAPALSLAANILARHPGQTTDFEPFVFFLSDGAPDDRAQAEQAADRLKKMHLASGTPHVISLGIGAASDEFLLQIASRPDLYKKLSSPQDIVKFFRVLGTQLGRLSGGARSVEQAIINLN
jgi:uncharacterized protein YegL